MDFEARLQTATAGISKNYFQLPVFGKESSIYRERCYCYELYHQLRKNWPEDALQLCGEIDKSGHPIIRGNMLDRTKPDFLVHIPENMDHNFAVIEVKPITGSARGIAKDFNTLKGYLDEGGYEHAYYLIYGSASHGQALNIATNHIQLINDSRIQIWHHHEAFAAATRVV